MHKRAVKKKNQGIRQVARVRQARAKKMWRSRLDWGNSSQEFNGEAGVQPSWCSDLHSSHELSFAGGASWCRRCGAAARRKPGSGLLMRACRRTVPSGSRYRLSWLERGRCICWMAWPDGRGAKERLKVCQATKGPEGTADTGEDEGEVVNFVFGSRCPNCSHRVCAC